MTLSEEPKIGALAAKLVEAVGTTFRGPVAVVEDAVACLLARGHLLIEDVPGVGKTTLALALGKAIGLGVHRLQFTPDTLPSDIVGLSIYDQKIQAFTFHPGPVFSPILLADEINRATPKAQAALLEAMNDRSVSVDGVTRLLPEPFLVLATQNPVEHLGTYPLPESQLDRFLMRIALGYPAPADERRLLRSGGAERDLGALTAVLDLETLLVLQGEVASVLVAEKLLDYMMAIVAATRRMPELALGVSPRGAQGLYRSVQARALIQGRSFAIPDDVKRMAGPILAHRVLASGAHRERGAAGSREREIIRNVLEEVPVPL